MKINFSKKEKNFQKKSISFYVNSYWKFAVFGSLAISLSFLVFNYYLFTEINKEMIVSTGDNKEQSNLVTKERINKTLEYFSLREQKSNQILYSASPVVDPSL